MLLYQHLKTKVDALKRLCKCVKSSVPFIPHYSNKHTFTAYEKHLSLQHHIHTKSIPSVWIVY
jgi:hypothetical protein